MAGTPPPSLDGLPLIGNGHQMMDQLAFGTRCRECDAGVVAASAGGETIYVVQDPDLIESVLVSEGESFGKTEFVRTQFARELGNADVEYDRRLGVALRTPLQGRRLQEALEGRTGWIASETRNRLRAVGGTRTDVHELFQSLAFDVFSTFVFDSDVTEPARLGEYIDAINEKNTFQQAALSEAVPLWDRVPTRTNRRYSWAVDGIETFVRSVLSDVDQDAPISRLWEVTDLGEDVDETVVISEVTTLLVGALEPLALAATYTCDSIARHPAVQRRLQAEVDDADRSDDDADRSDDGADRSDDDLPYLDAVISESLRLHPPVHTIFRVVSEPVEIGGYDLEPGARVWLPTWNVHRDPRFFDRPETFDPGRWLGSSDRPDFAFIPFAGGRRQCAGKWFAKAVLRVVIRTILETAWLDPVGEPPTLRPELSLRPVDDVKLAVTERATEQ